MVTPTISQRGQRAHENLSRWRSEKKKKKKKNDYSARRARKHLALRLGEEKNKLQKIQQSPRGHTPRIATRKNKNKQKQKTTALATQAYASRSEWKYKEKPDYNTRLRSDLKRTKTETNYSHTVTAEKKTKTDYRFCSGGRPGLATARRARALTPTLQ